MNTELMFSSATPEHFTPPWILDLVEKVGPIGLDPCAHAKAAALRRVKTGFMLTRPSDFADRGVVCCDGLLMDWSAYTHGELVFVNPPYGRELAKWAAKIASEKDCAIVALVPARVDTGWWRELYPIAWCALAGRLKFGSLNAEGDVIEAANSAPFPSAVCLLHAQHLRDRFVEVFRPHGVVYGRL